MLEQFLLMLQNPIQATVQAVLIRHRKIHAQQHVHRALIEPLPVQSKLAVWLDQSIHYQQFQHLRPTHALPAARQLLLREPIQFQLPPQLASQPAIPVRPRTPQLHRAQLYPDRVKDICGNRTVFWKQTQCGRAPLLFIEHLQRFTPGCLLAVVDLSQIQHPPLYHLAGLQPPTFFDAVVAMFFTVLLPSVTSQEHAPVQNARLLSSFLLYRGWVCTTSDRENVLLDGQAVSVRPGRFLPGSSAHLRRSG